MASQSHMLCVAHFNLTLSGAVPIYTLHSITVWVWHQTLQGDICRKRRKDKRGTAIDHQWDQLQSQSANQWMNDCFPSVCNYRVFFSYHDIKICVTSLSNAIV
jgi:hypothetical protein